MWRDDFWQVGPYFVWKEGMNSIGIRQYDYTVNTVVLEACGLGSGIVKGGDSATKGPSVVWWSQGMVPE